MASRLTWSDPDDFGVQEAKEGSYTYVVWANENNDFATLRIIRKAIATGTEMALPFWDLPVNGPDRNHLRALANTLADLFSDFAKYNEPDVEPGIGF